MRAFRITIFVLALLIPLSWGSWTVYVSKRHEKLVSLLQRRHLSEARAMLNGFHDWDEILRRVKRSADPTLVQMAFDVQFEHWYSKADDTNYSYPEHPEVARHLLAAGARPEFRHLLHATQQNKMIVARVLLDAGVPAREVGAPDTPLANAAYWGDLELVQRLIGRGADVNESSAKGWRPILAAAWACHADCVRYLVEHGADVSLPYELWEGNVEPIWKVIEDRASQGPDFSNVWMIVRAKMPTGALAWPVDALSDICVWLSISIITWSPHSYHS
jgi:hypothetical protein